MRGLGLMDLNDAAAYLGMKPHQLRHLAYTGRISFFQMGKRRRYWFSPAQLMEWQTASKMAVEQAEEDLRKLERIDSMFGSGDCDIADYRDWVIIGAESGHGARPMDNDWALRIIDKADAAGCAVFVKQLSGGVPLTNLRRREYPSAALDLRANHG